jgi:hypothetical protein
MHLARSGWLRLHCLNLGAEGEVMEGWGCGDGLTEEYAFAVEHQQQEQSWGLHRGVGCVEERDGFIPERFFSLRSYRRTRLVLV